MMTGPATVILATCLSFSSPILATTLRLIDEYFENRWRHAQIHPTDAASDYEFLRRASLDIIGRVPTPGEVRVFTQTPNRQQTCSQLTHHKEFARHWSHQWANWLIPRDNEARSEQYSAIAKWLHGSFKKSDSRWDKIAWDLISHTPWTRAYDKAHLGEKNGETYTREPLTENISRNFLGIRIECAKCHNHKFDKNLIQSLYWGLNAFFRQEEKPGPQRHVPFWIPDGRRMTTEPRFLDGSTLNEKGHVVRADGSIANTDSLDARSALAFLITNNPHFARAFVNRVWGQMFGRGLGVGEIDDIGDPSKVPHFDFLVRLGEWFRKNEYDVRKIVTDICTSRLYGLSSKGRSQNDELFNGSLLRPLTLEQFAESLATVFGQDPDSMVYSDIYEDQDFSGKLFLNGGNPMALRDAWIDTLYRAKYSTDSGKPEQFSLSIPAVLELLHGSRLSQTIDQFTPVATADEEIVRELFLKTVNRPPSAEELATVLRRVPASTEEKVLYWRDILLALINTAEFKLNH